MAKVIKKIKKMNNYLGFSSFTAFVVVTSFGLNSSLADNVNTLPKKTEVSKESPLYVANNSQISSFDNTKSLINENKKLKQERDQAVTHYRELREKYQKLHSFCEKSEQSCLNIEKVKTKGPSEALDLSFIKNEIISSKEKNKLLLAEIEKLKKDIVQKDTDLRTVLSTVKKTKEELEGRKKAEKSCIDQIDQSSKLVLRIPELEKEIMSLNNQLLLKKTASEMLSRKVSPQTEENVANNQIAVEQPRVVRPEVRREEVRREEPQVNLNADVAVVEVLADKVSLRVGPGTEHSAIMDVQRGTRLTVEAKEGSWLRVNSPTGGRAYINSEYIRTLGGRRASLSQEKPIVTQVPEMKKPTSLVKSSSIAKPVRRATNNEDLESFGELKSADGSPEAIALEKLIKGMGQGGESVSK